MAESDVQHAKNPVTPYSGEQATTLLNLVRDNPGRSANAYARMLGWTHSDTRRMLGLLEHLGDLQSRRTTTYAVTR